MVRATGSADILGARHRVREWLRGRRLYRTAVREAQPVSSQGEGKPLITQIGADGEEPRITRIGAKGRVHRLPHGVTHGGIDGRVASDTTTCPRDVSLTQ